MKEKIIILSGTGDPSVIANNIYTRELQNDYDLFIVEERKSIAYIFNFLYKKLRKKGVLHIFSLIFLKIYKQLFSNTRQIQKEYTCSLVVGNINDEKVKDILKKEKYKFVIANACSILYEDTLRSSQKKIINLHNGINPRYRGTGNFWAFYEKNFDLVGVTIHYIDNGIDTGEIIDIVPCNEQLLEDKFDNIDINAFEIGAKEISKIVLKQSNKEKNVENFKHLRSKYYSLPSFAEYLQAKKNFNLEKKRLNKKEELWRKSFNEKALNTKESSLEKQHWSDKNIVAWHDNVILQKINQMGKVSVLDIGCGDARYADLIQKKIFYIGIDYSFEIIKIGKDSSYTDKICYPFPVKKEIDSKNFLSKKNVLLIENKADSLPIEDRSVDLVLAVGLFQHLDSPEGVLNEMTRCMQENGKIIINTLRQFSNVELLMIMLFFGWKKDIRNLVYAIYKKEYGEMVNGTLLATRYTVSELEKSIKKRGLKIDKVIYNGLFASRLFAREIIMEVSRV